VLYNAFGPGSSGLRLHPSRSSRGVGTMHHHPPGGADVVSRASTEHLDDPIGCGLKSEPVRKLFLPLEIPGWPSAPTPSLGMVEGRYGGLDSML
jgi:hypothetical protein